MQKGILYKLTMNNARERPLRIMWLWQDGEGKEHSVLTSGSSRPDEGRYGAGAEADSTDSGAGGGGNGFISYISFLSFIFYLLSFICQRGRRVAGGELRHLAGSPGGGGVIRSCHTLARVNTV